MSQVVLEETKSKMQSSSFYDYVDENENISGGIGSSKKSIKKLTGLTSPGILSIGSGDSKNKLP